MDVSHCVTFGNLKCLLDNRYLFLLFYAITPYVKKAANAIKALKLAMVVMGVHWAPINDNDPVYASQQFNEFLGSWKISHNTVIPCNPQEKPLWRGPTELLRSCCLGLSLHRLGEILIWP